MNHDKTPVLEAIDQYRRSDDYTFQAGVAEWDPLKLGVDAMPPRDAYFGETEDAADPAGRISAEMISPYPPGVPAVLPGERFNRAVVDYLRAGVAAGMEVPDASDPKLGTFRVVPG